MSTVLGFCQSAVPLSICLVLALSARILSTSWTLRKPLQKDPLSLVTLARALLARLCMCSGMYLASEPLGDLRRSARSTNLLGLFKHAAPLCDEGQHGTGT